MLVSSTIAFIQDTQLHLAKDQSIKFQYDVPMCFTTLVHQEENS